MCLSRVEDCPILGECVQKWTAVTSSDIHCFEEKQEMSQHVAHGNAVLPVLYLGGIVGYLLLQKL